MIRKRILEILVEEKLIEPEHQDIALERQRLYGGKIGGHLLALGYIDARSLSHGLSIKYNTPEIDPTVLKQINTKLISEFPINLAKKYTVLPLMKIKNILSVVIADPTNRKALDQIKEQTGYDVRPFVAPESIIKKYIKEYYNLDDSYLKPEPSENKYDRQDDSIAKSFFARPPANIESYIPSSELFIANPEIGKEEKKEVIKQFHLLAAPTDSLIFDLTHSKSIRDFAEKIIDKLFLGLQRVLFLEIGSDFLQPIAHRGWPIGVKTKKPPRFDLTPESLNLHALLQDNFYSGFLGDIVTDDLGLYLTGYLVPNMESFNSLFLVLSHNNRLLFILYGDLNGQPIPEQYVMQWKELLPKLQEALEYMVPYIY